MFSETGRTLIVAQGDKFLFIDVATVEALERLPSDSNSVSAAGKVVTHCGLHRPPARGLVCCVHAFDRCRASAKAPSENHFTAESGCPRSTYESAASAD